MSYDLTIRPSRRNAPLKPVAGLEAFLASQPSVRRNGSESYVLDDGVRWMEIDLEVGGGTREVLEQVRAHIPYGKLGDHPERDYFPLLKAIAAELKWKLHDEQTEERKDPDFEEADPASVEYLLTLESVRPWLDPETWNRLFPALEAVLADRLDRLDENDPVRRRVTDSSKEGDYVTKFGPCEETRWLFGRFAKTKVRILIHHHSSFGDRDYNDFAMFFDARFGFKLGTRGVKSLMTILAQHLQPFYGICDLKVLRNSRKASPPQSTLALDRELNGVFWFTCFNRAYVEFFGREKFAAAPHVQDLPTGGVLLRLGDDPAKVPDERRKEMEITLGQNSFASFGSNKEIGQHVLTMEQLRAVEDA